MSYYSEELKTEAVRAYLADPRATEQDIALIYGMSQKTLSRALADHGHKTLARYKTTEEHRMLTYLKSQKISSLQVLINRL